MATTDRPVTPDLQVAATLRHTGLTAATLQRTPPVYHHIFRAMERAVAGGAISPGTRLPAERQLALALKVSRATVVKAYRELEARGVARGYVGRGTFVAGAPGASGR